MNERDIDRTYDPAFTWSPRCSVCDAQTGTRICRKREFELVSCACGAVYLRPAVIDDLVDHTLDPHPSSFYSLPAPMKVRWLAKTRATGTLLEVGFGDGHFLRAARAHGFEVAGIELHPERAARVARDLGIPVECSA